jgi:hypothetical protein
MAAGSARRSGRNPASAVGLGIAPAMLSLAMVLTYSIVLGTVYIALDSQSN